MKQIIDEALKMQVLNDYHLDTSLPTTVCDAMKLCQFDAQEYLCIEGEPLKDFYFMIKGKCMVTKLLGNGKQNLISFYDSFTLFGEFELIERVPASCTVEVLESALCLVLPHQQCREALLGDIHFLNCLCRFFTQKMRRLDHNSSITQSCTVEEKLASYITSIQKNMVFRENHVHLAEYLGCSHRQLLRALNQFCQRGWLRKEKHGYVLLSPDELKRLSNDIYLLDNNTALIFDDIALG